MKAYHTLVTGDSGGGKTTLMRELYHRPGVECRVVWVNHNSETGLGGHGNRDAETVDSLRGLRTSTARSVNYHVDDQEAGLERTVEFAVEYWEECGVPVQVMVDECDNVWPSKQDDASDNALKWALHEGRDRGLVVRMATQDPSDLKPYTPLKQCRYLVWVGEWSGWHEGFLNAHDWIPRSELPKNDYRYVVMNKRGDVVFEDRTDPDFG